MTAVAISAFIIHAIIKKLLSYSAYPTEKGLLQPYKPHFEGSSGADIPVKSPDSTDIRFSSTSSKGGQHGDHHGKN